MEDERDAERLEAPPGELRPLGRRRGREAWPKDMREADSRLLKHRPFGQHSRPAAPAFGPFPGFLDEAAASVLGLYRRTDAVLKGEEVGFDDGEEGQLSWPK